MAQDDDGREKEAQGRQDGPPGLFFCPSVDQCDGLMHDKC